MRNNRTAVRIGISIILSWLLLTTSLALPKTLVPGGGTIGIELFTDGLVITDTSGAVPGIQKGDVIQAANGSQLKTADDLRTVLSDGGSISLSILRGGERKTITVEPIMTAEGYRIGAAIRDRIAGIGTVCYYDPQTGAFGALGHGVNDPSGGGLIPMEHGVAIWSSVSHVQKGEDGQIGMLIGEFDVKNKIGTIDCNTEQGIFGTMKAPSAGQDVAVADAAEIEIGEASILCNVSGEKIQEYSVEILKLYDKNTPTRRNLLLRVTDPALLEVTGGIVQGMSGSPILQNGKLIGAVTHVLLSDAQKGYGIYIENMFRDAA